MSSRLQKLRRESHSLRNQLLVLEEQAKNLDEEIEALRGWLRILDDTQELPAEALRYLGIPSHRTNSISPFLLKIRIKGMLREMQARLWSVRSKQHNKREILENLSVCYACGGTGMKTGKTRYERHDSFVAVVPTLDPCL